MKEHSRFQCEVCGKEWSFRQLAQLCEQYQLEPTSIKAGDEVKLQNRNVGYTVAVVKDISIVSSGYPFDPQSEDLLQKQMPYFQTAQYHRRILWLDRPVFLAHKWEGHLQAIDPDVYVLTEEEASGMQRDDNNAW